jgi:hypothetical protein
MPETFITLRLAQLTIEEGARRPPSGSVQTDEIRRGPGRGSLFVLVDCDDPSAATRAARRMRLAYTEGEFVSATEGLISAVQSLMSGRSNNIEEDGIRGVIAALFRDGRLYFATAGEASLSRTWRNRLSRLDARPTPESFGEWPVGVGHCEINDGDVVLLSGCQCDTAIFQAVPGFLAEYGLQGGLLECHRQYRDAFPLWITIATLSAEEREIPDRPERSRPARRPRPTSRQFDEAVTDDPGSAATAEAQDAPVEGENRFPNRQIFLAASGIIAAVVMLIVVLLFFREGSTSCDTYTLLQTAERREADAGTTADVATKRRSLLVAEQAAAQAVACSPDDKGAISTHARIREQLDALGNVVTSSWGSTRIVNSEGVYQVALIDDTLYVLDSSDGTLTQYSIAGQSLVPASKDGVLLRRGDRSGSMVAGDLVAMAWAPPGGGRENAGLVCLSHNGLLFEQEPRRPISVTTLRPGPAWDKIRSVGSYAGALYLLDPQTREIFWYQATPDGYVGQPFRYLDPSTTLDLSAARQILVGEDVLVLMNDGRVKRLQTGREATLELKTPEGPVGKIVRLHSRNQWLFVADAEGHRIVQFDRGGNFVQQWRYESDNDLFANLRDFAVDRSKKRVLLVNNRGVFLLEWPGEN